MKKIIYPFLLLFWTSVAVVHGATQVVVPNNLANVEGNSSTTFDSTSFRFQEVFDASQFGGLLGGGQTARVNSISFRNDGGSTDRVLLFFGGGTVRLSTTQRTPDGLDTTFSANEGADATAVYLGGISFGTSYQ